MPGQIIHQWNNTVYRMNYWVHTAGRYRTTFILGRVYVAFFNSHQIEAMIYMSDENENHFGKDDDCPGLRI